MKYNSELFAEHLQKMVQFPTVSCVNSDDMDMDAFLGLHKCLEEMYPVVHSKMTKEIIGKAGLLYSYKCKGTPKRMPMMLIAHQDVVPEGDHSLWKYPPYSAEIHDGMIWARGTTDSKCNIQAYMDALEILFSRGFEPDFDLYLGFGYNEEVMGAGVPAAQMIADTLKQRGVELGCLLDECGGINHTKDGKTYGEIFIAEKGYVDVEVSVSDKGGHSAMPVKNGAFVQLSKALIAVDENPMAVRLIDATVSMLEASVPYLENKEVAALCNDVRGNWDKLAPLMEADRQLNALIRTTSAITMAKGSDQANILPAKASAIINNRLLPGETMDDLMAHYKSILPEGVDVRIVRGTNPPKMQKTDTEAYNIIMSVFEDKYPGLTVIPSVCYGGTDSRYYCDVCPTDSVYRVTGLNFDDRFTGTAHAANERIPVDILADNVDFYIRLLEKYNA